MSVTQLAQPDAGTSLKACRLAAGQTALYDLRALSSIMAIEGSLRLAFRDRSLAWLGDRLPAITLVLSEGEHYSVPQHGSISIQVERGATAAFVVQPYRRGSAAAGLAQRALHGLFRLLPGGYPRSRPRRPT